LVIIAAAKARGIPAAICATLPENIDPETRDWLVAQGVAPMQGLTETLDAMRAAGLWAERRAQIMAKRPAPLLALRDLATLQTVDEAAGKALLSTLGLPIPAGEVVAGAQVVQAASSIGYPVVLKMMGPKLAHKSEAGAVAVGLANATDLTAALQKMRADVTAHDPLALTDRFLVEAMAPRPLAELLVNLRRDAQFGLVLTLGAGGVLVELLEDAATLLLPASAAQIEAALNGLKIARILRGYRGARGADMAALAGFISQLCQLFESHSAALAEVEINPLFVTATGPWVVDVLIQKAGPL
jgi:acyl-CoA synthetase (NDP forming)